jgi:hypothetical protein
MPTVSAFSDSMLYYSSQTIVGNSTFTYTDTIGMTIENNILPFSTNTYTLGNSTQTWKAVFIGPGSIHVIGEDGAEAKLGVDQNSIIYAQKGFATPFINIGPSIATIEDPGAIGGWVLGPTGTLGSDDYDLIAQQKLPGASVPAGLTGQVYSLIKGAPTGPTGPAYGGKPVNIIPGNSTSTTHVIDLSGVEMGTRYFVEYHSQLSELTLYTPNWNASQNLWNCYIKNGSQSNVTVFHSPDGTTSTQINSAYNNIIFDSVLHAENLNGSQANNAPFVYIYWDSSNLVMM